MDQKKALYEVIKENLVNGELPDSFSLPKDENTDQNKIRLMQSFKANKRQIFFKLILPSNFSSIISVLKVNLSLTFIGVIMGEFLVSKAGVGYLIMYGSQVFNLNLVVTGIILLAVMASIMYYLILFIEKRLSKNR